MKGAQRGSTHKYKPPVPIIVSNYKQSLPIQCRCMMLLLSIGGVMAKDTWTSEKDTYGYGYNRSKCIGNALP